MTAKQAFARGGWVEMQVTADGFPYFSETARHEGQLQRMRKAVSRSAAEARRIYGRSKVRVTTKYYGYAANPATGKRRSIARAAGALLKKVNPGMKRGVTVSVRRLKGGGVSVIPLKVKR